jgi:flagellar protein FliS
MSDYRSPASEQALHYLRQQIENASPAQQVVLLYDGAIKFVMQAREAIGRGDIQGRYNANQRAISIVGYLLEILDAEKGGEVGARLQRIYTFLLKKLLEIDFKNDVAVCDEVVEHLRILRASWHQIATQGVGPAVQAAPAPSGAGDVEMPVRRSAVA